MNITITGIHFTVEEISTFNDDGEDITKPVAAHIDYTVKKQGNELDGTININFGKYKEMKHDEIITLIDKEFNDFVSK